MDLLINNSRPEVMHIDLNSCFATVMQQAFPHLRNHPLVIAAYTTGGGCILSPSIEAKKLGIKTGMRVRDAKQICSEVIVRESDTDLIRDVSANFMRICHDYSPDVTPKSVDELVINFSGLEDYHKKTLVQIGAEIKKRFREEIGEWISCNVGIATNRFLAKFASSLHKPDGLDVIDHKNLKEIYKNRVLTDLHGINTRFEFRLNQAGINNPLDFLKASDNFLRKIVFKGIAGHYWFLRLRGFEIDDFKTERKSFGQEYSLGEKTRDPEKLIALIMMLTEKMGRRLRFSEQTASGIHLGLLYDDFTYWHRGKKFDEYLYTTSELFKKILIIFRDQPFKKIVRKISVTCFDLHPNDSQTLSLFEDSVEKKRKVSVVVDKINDRWGEYVVTPAIMVQSKKTILDRIAFGSLR